VPSGLLQTNITDCAVFAAISASSVATAALTGGVALRQLIERNCNGSLAAGGGLGDRP
jgi:TRAP-type C4-dicarboxylate transport system permease large subunit